MEPDKKDKAIASFVESMGKHCKNSEEVHQVIRLIRKVSEYFENLREHPLSSIIDVRDIKKIVAEYSSDDVLAATTENVTDEYIVGLAISRTYENELGKLSEIVENLNI